MVRLCLGTLGSGGVPTLPVGSPISGPVGVLPQSTTVTWLSLLWLGLLLIFVRFHCLRLTLSALACAGPRGCPTFSRVGVAPSPWVPLLWPGWRGSLPPFFLLLCLLSGCGHPLGSLVSSVTIDRRWKFPVEEFSFVW